VKRLAEKPDLEVSAVKSRPAPDWARKVRKMFPAGEPRGPVLFLTRASNKFVAIVGKRI
jgi:hypothetical protein